MAEQLTGKLKAMEAARKTIEATIADHERAIARIRVDKNRTLPVARLPREFLCKLFLSVARSTHTHHRPYGWIRITHVCHDWREIALADSNLWSAVDLVKRTECLREIFSRSRDAPLDVMTPSLIWDTDVLELAMEEIGRIRTLSLFVKAGLIMPEVCPSTTAPKLERLALTTDTHHPPTPLVFAEIHMPKLAFLELSNFRIPWGSHIFSNSLTRLTWSGGSHPESRSPHMLAAFAGMPLLEYLSLTGVLPPAEPASTDPQPPPPQTVNLPHLRSLRLTDTGPSCTQFLRHISYPSTTILVIALTFGTGTGPDVSALCDVVSTRITDGQPLAGELHPYIRSLTVNCSSKDPEILAWTEPFDVAKIVDMAEQQRYPHVFLRISAHGSSFRRRVGVLDMLQHLPIFDVQTLYLQEGTDAGVLAHWSDMAKCMSKVKQLAVGSNQYMETEISSQLTVSATKSTARRPPRKSMLFRRLKTLMLIDVLFREDPEDMDDNHVLQAYRQMFASRLKAGHMIEELILHDVINIGERDVRRMKKFVGKVTWNPDEVIWQSDPDGYASDSCSDSDFYDDLYDSDDLVSHNYLGF